MTGISLPWGMNERALKRYKRYCKNLIAGIFIASGSFLMLEHLITFKGFDLLDFAGHEYYGGVLIFIGFLIGMKWYQWKTLNLKNIRNWIR